MSISFVAKTISEATGWQNAKTVASAIIFELEDELNLKIYSPDDKRVFLQGTVLALEENGQTTQDVCLKIAKLALGTCKKMQSIVFIEDDVLKLELAVDNACESLSILHQTEIFLNELRFIKQFLAHK